MKMMLSREQIQEKIDSCRFGADYYPEHWPRERWEIDAAMMEEIGFQVVRMAEFAWSKMEPRENEFDFAWLDEAIEILASHGMMTILGTPTAAPPAWIIEKDPDILPIDMQGQRKSFGARHHDCMSNQKYRGHIRRIVTAMAEHYKDNPHVIGWQIDNELGNSHYELCTCDSCRRAFQVWAEQKYKTTERLNEAWGTTFWSQTYDRFEQIPAPRTTPVGAFNPSYFLDWKRFCSELVVDFQHEQVKILRTICPHQQITHNLMGLYDKTDYFEFAKDLDFASNDQYPTGYYFDTIQSPAEIGACLDLIRSTKKKNIWMMELISGATGGNLIGHTPRTGQLMLWTADCIAHGCDTIVYFRWRTCLYGMEEYWHGILPHNGVPGRRHKEIAETVKRFTPILDDIHGIYDRKKAAILFSYDQDWAFQVQPNHPKLTYTGEIVRYYEAFHALNVPVEFISEADQLEDYQIVVAPLLYLQKKEITGKLTAFARNGGTLVLTMRSGVKNETNICLSESALPGELIEAAGLTIDEYDCLIWENTRVRIGDHEGEGNLWADGVTLSSAVSIAEFTSGIFAGMPAATRNCFGRGQVYYIATAPDQKIMQLLAKEWMQHSAMTGIDQTPEGVELTIREGKEKDYLFVMNHNGEEKSVTVKGKLITAKPYGVEILTRKKGDTEWMH